MKALINDCGSGIKDGMRFKAAFPSGPSNAPVAESQLDIPLDFESLKEANSGLGSAAVTVVGDDRCIVNTVAGFSRFLWRSHADSVLRARWGLLRCTDSLGR